MEIIGTSPPNPPSRTGDAVRAAVDLRVGRIFQALVKGMTAEGLLKLQVGRQQLLAQTQARIPAGQTLTLRVDRAGQTPELSILLPPSPAGIKAGALRQILPRMLELAPVLTRLLESGNGDAPGAMSAEARTQVAQLLRQLPTPSQVTTPAGLRAAVQSSGLFTESALASGATPTGEIKTLLLRVAARLRSGVPATGPRPASSQPPATTPPAEPRRPPTQAARPPNTPNPSNQPNPQTSPPRVPVQGRATPTAAAPPRAHPTPAASPQPTTAPTAARPGLPPPAVPASPRSHPHPNAEAGPEGKPGQPLSGPRNPPATAARGAVPVATGSPAATRQPATAPLPPGPLPPLPPPRPGISPPASATSPQGAATTLPEPPPTAREATGTSRPSLPQGAERPADAKTPTPNPPEPPAARLVQDLARQVEGAVARIQYNQLASLPQEDGSRQVWQLDLPVRSGERLDSFQLRIQEEPSKHGAEREGASWTVNLAFDLEPLGPVRARIGLLGDTVSSTFWAERQATAELISRRLEELRTGFRRAGLAVGELNARLGLPSEPVVKGVHDPLVDEQA